MNTNKNSKKRKLIDIDSNDTQPRPKKRRLNGKPAPQIIPAPPTASASQTVPVPPTASAPPTASVPRTVSVLPTASVHRAVPVPQTNSEHIIVKPDNNQNRNNTRSRPRIPVVAPRTAIMQNRDEIAKNRQAALSNRKEVMNNKVKVEYLIRNQVTTNRRLAEIDAKLARIDAEQKEQKVLIATLQEATTNMINVITPDQNNDALERFLNHIKNKIKNNTSNMSGMPPSSGSGKVSISSNNNNNSTVIISSNPPPAPVMNQNSAATNNPFACINNPVESLESFRAVLRNIGQNKEEPQTISNSNSNSNSSSNSNSNSNNNNLVNNSQPVTSHSLNVPHTAREIPRLEEDDDKESENENAKNSASHPLT